MHGPSTRRWAGPTRLARPMLLVLAMLVVAPGGPTALAQDDPIDPVETAGCGMGSRKFAGTTTLLRAPADLSTSPTAEPAADRPVARAAAITVIPPTAATAGISAGARGFRTTAGKRPAWLTPFLGSIVFSAVDDARGREPWIATPITARRLKDVSPGATSSSPRDQM